MSYYLDEFLALRADLVAELEKKENYVRFLPSLAGMTKSGALQLAGTTWKWRRHGVGVRFEGKNQVVIEAFRLNAPSEAFDRMEFEEYLESIGFEEGIIEATIDKIVAQLPKKDGMFVVG